MLFDCDTCKNTGSVCEGCMQPVRDCRCLTGPGTVDCPDCEPFDDTEDTADDDGVFY